MKKPLLLMPLACFLFLAATSQARLNETVQEIEARYGKVIKSIKPEYPATLAGLYETNGVRITVGFYQNKSYYEQFQKIDPKNPNSFPAISETERGFFLQANSNGEVWKGHAVEAFLTDGRSYFKTTYDRSDGLAKATYDDDKKVLTVRLEIVENLDALKERERQRENLRGF